MNTRFSIKYLILIVSIVFIAFYIIAPNRRGDLMQTSSGMQQCKNAETIMKIVESYKTTYGYYPFSLANLLDYQNNLVERSLYKFSGDSYYLNNYGYSTIVNGYEVTFIGPKSGKTYLIRSKEALSSTCIAGKFDSL